MDQDAIQLMLIRDKSEWSNLTTFLDGVCVALKLLILHVE